MRGRFGALWFFERKIIVHKMLNTFRQNYFNCFQALQVHWNTEWSLGSFKIAKVSKKLWFWYLKWFTVGTKKNFQLYLRILKGFRLFWSVLECPGAFYEIVKVWRRKGANLSKVWNYNGNGLWAFVLLVPFCDSSCWVIERRSWEYLLEMSMYKYDDLSAYSVKKSHHRSFFKLPIKSV